MRETQTKGNLADAGKEWGGTVRSSHGWLRWMAGAAACWLLAAPAAAQVTYSCRDERGTTYTLSRPCPPGMKTTVVSAGPVSGQRSESLSEPSYSPPAYTAPAPDYQRYMSARCRTLSDTQRSGYASGIKPDVMAAMRREYERDCREQESDASSRYYQEQRDARKRRQEEERQTAQAEQLAQEHGARVAQQCAESRRVLAAKKARTDLTDGEKNDLRRFEEAVTARCTR